MENLAGVPTCDRTIVTELRQAGIPMAFSPEQHQFEVPASITGVLTRQGQIVFRLRRAWYYWVVTGDVPLDVAKELYRDPVGKKDVRASGDCVCRPPDLWARQRAGDQRVVDLYHIDSQEGLDLFVVTLRAHELVD